MPVHPGCPRPSLAMAYRLTRCATAKALVVAHLFLGAMAIASTYKHFPTSVEEPLGHKQFLSDAVGGPWTSHLRLNDVEGIEAKGESSSIGIHGGRTVAAEGAGE